ncbi:hypothetical protein K0U83_01110 [bacterium]|nr:hypothetical protein [bacterium]
MAKKKTGFALMNPQKPLGIMVPLTASAVWGVAALSPLPGDGVLFGIGAFATWAKYFADRGVSFGTGKSNPRKNPVFFAAPLLMGAATLGAAGMAYYYFKDRKEVEERQASVDEVLEDNPFFRFATPAIFAAAGALLGARSGSSLKGGLMGLGIGFATKRLVREVMYIQYDASSKMARRLDDAGIIDIDAIEVS